MSVSGKVMDALRSGIVLNERLNTLVEKVDRIDHDLRHVSDRLIRIETMVEMAQKQRPSQSQIETE